MSLSISTSAGRSPIRSGTGGSGTYNWAIGGITGDNAAGLIAAGADAVAVVSALFDAIDVEAQARRFARLFQLPVNS